MCVFIAFKYKNISMTDQDESLYIFKFNLEHSYEHRKQESVRLLSSFKSRLPIIIEKDSSCPYPNLPKNAFLPPDHIKLSNLTQIIRKRLKLSSKKPLYIYANGINLLEDTSKLSLLYNKYRSSDGFLYLLYHNQFKSLENSENLPRAKTYA